MNITTKRALYIDIHQAIESSIAGLSQNQEPDYIAALITKLPKALASILNKHIQTIRFNVGGCFIHQKPLAKFCNPRISNKSPEIGDLLIVYKEIHPDDKKYYNALLLQAKKTDNIYNTPIHNNDQHQLILYTQWPRFKYDRAGCLNGLIRSVHPKTITPGAQYLLIDEQKSLLDTTFWCAKANNTLIGDNSLAHQIVHLLEFQTGRPFVCLSKGRDHWSRMIWDLLYLSSLSTFNRRRAEFIETSRYSGDLISAIANNPISNEQTTETGISILCIEGTFMQRL